MKILLPTDGSRYALGAARALTGWFDWPGGEVDVLAVVPEEPKSDHRDFGKDTEDRQDWRGAVSRWLHDTTARLEGSGLRARELVKNGDPATVALDVARSGYDLVAVGAKGRGESPHFEGESVAAALLEHSPTSVLLVRERESGGRAHRLPTPQEPLRVLLAVDGRALSETAVSVCKDLMDAGRVEMTAVGVADGDVGGPLTEPDARKSVHSAASVLEGHGFAARAQVATGDAATEILASADEADLIVMGSRRAPAPGDGYLGSVGLEVARSSPCSVLIVREGAPAVAEQPRKAPEAATPFDIAYENVEPSLAWEAHVIRGLAQLERVTPDLLGVRVTLAKRNPRRHAGDLFDVHIELTLPGPDVVVSRTSSWHHESEELTTAIHEAFEKAQRALVELRAQQRGEVKTHEPHRLGRVRDVFPDYGFIEGSDGRVVYFHRNSVQDDAWDDLEVGDDVRFVDEPGEKGPHATTVRVVRKRERAG